MILADDMGGNDHLPVFATVEIGDEDGLIGFPTAACHKHMASSTDKGLYNGQMFRLLLDLEHPIETGVAGHGHIRDTNLGQQFAALLVLHIEMGETTQHPGITAGIPAEENLVGTEDARHAVDGYISAFQDMQIIVPELILDEEGHHRTHQSQETDGIKWRVKRKITDDVGTLIILAHLVTRRREEGEQNLVLRMELAHPLHDGTALFKLAQRGGMEP